MLMALAQLLLVVKFVLLLDYLSLQQLENNTSYLWLSHYFPSMLLVAFLASTSGRR